MKESTKVFLESFKDAKSSRDTLAANVAKLASKRSLITYALNKMGINKEENRLEAHVSCNYLGVVVIHASLHGLDSFKDARLLKVLDALEDLYPESVKCEEWATYVEKDFVYKYGAFTIQLNAYVRSDSDSCRRVVESVKLIEQPTYKIVCD
jgi:hypothetical protein